MQYVNITVTISQAQGGLLPRCRGCGLSLGWLLHLGMRLAGAALTLAAHTLATLGDHRGGRAIDDISQVVFKAVDLYS